MREVRAVGTSRILQAGHHGAPGHAGIVLSESVGKQIVGILARRNQAHALASAIRAEWGVELPDGPRREPGAAFDIVWSGHDRWLAVSGGTERDLERELRTRLAGVASIVALGDGRVLLTLSGPRVRDMLAKVVPIDLDDSVFPVGRTALTLAGHIHVQLTRTGAAPTYELMVGRSYAASLCSCLLAAGAEYGIDIVDYGDPDGTGASARAAGTASETRPNSSASVC